jgi:hypothetical protein
VTPLADAAASTGGLPTRSSAGCSAGPRSRGSVDQTSWLATVALGSAVAG